MKRIEASRTESRQLKTTARESGSRDYHPEIPWHLTPIYESSLNVGQEIWPDCSD